MRALCSNDAQEVRELLDKEPALAAEPFWDHDFEPPLCCAVRCNCDAEIVKQLLQFGADVDALDTKGQTPLVILASDCLPPSVMEPGLFPVANRLGSFGDVYGGACPPGPFLDMVTGKSPAECQEDISRALCAAGADPFSKDSSGKTPIQVARDSGNGRLVRHWLDQRGEPAPVRQGAPATGGGTGERQWPALFAN